MNNLSNADISSALQSLESGYAPLPASAEVVIARALRELLALREAGKEPVYQYQIDGAWHDCDYEFYSGCHETYRRVTYAAPQLPAVPDGWVMVPIEPTRKMLDAFKAAYEKDESYAEHWQRMIAAAPKPEASSE